MSGQLDLVGQKKPRDETHVRATWRDRKELVQRPEKSPLVLQRAGVQYSNECCLEVVHVNTSCSRRLVSI